MATKPYKILVKIPDAGRWWLPDIPSQKKLLSRPTLY